jgi:Uma2 family endonuclease
MSEPKKRRATYQDVIDSPPNMVAEIINGELRLSTRPRPPALAAASTLGEELGPPFKRGRGGPGGWHILDEPELHLGEEILVPDLAGWRRERMPIIPDEEGIRLAPDWVCEVLSKSTRRADRAEKMPLYASFGIAYAWLVDPRDRTLEAFRLENGRWSAIAVHKDNERARIEPFDAIELDLALLWADVALPTRAGEGATEYEYADW